MKASAAAEKDNLIRQLRDDLWVARFNIVQLMPDKAKDILDERSGVDSFEDLGKWTHWAINALVDLANQVAEIGDDSRLRAPCPLCKGGTSSPYLDGYALPLGLSRHLEGWRSSTRCPVFKAAYDMARESVIDKRDNPTQQPSWRSAAMRPRPW